MRKTKRISAALADAPAPAEEPAAAAPCSPLSRVHDLAAVCHAAPPSPALRAALANEAAPAVPAPVAAEAVAAEPEETPWRPTPDAARRARELVGKYTLLACGSGLVPSAGLYLAAGAAAMAKMLHDLSALYGCPRISWPRVGMLALVGGLVATGGVGLVADLVGAALPGLGRLLRATRPLSIGVATYAVGTAAIRHFESPRGRNEPLSATALAAAAGGLKNQAREAVLAMRPA